MSRSASADQARILGLKDRKIDLRVLVEDADGVMRNLADLQGVNWVSFAEWGEDIDDQVMSAKIGLIRESYSKSIARDVETSRLNLDSAGAYAPLLDAARRIRIETAVAAQDSPVPSSLWVECFDGIIDIVDWSQPIVEITARDFIGSRLQDLWIEGGSETYGAAAPGSPVQTEMQAILDDWGPQRPSLGEPAINLYTPTSPSWNILEYHQEQMPVLQALQERAAQIGWVVRTIWDNGTNAWRLTFMAPDRTKSTPDLTFTADDYFEVQRCSVDLATIRNVCEVVYTDSTIAEDANDATGGRRTVTVTNATSIGKYGRRWMQIAEASTSNINRSNEATALAQAAVNDLSEPKASLTIRQKFDWRIQLYDLLRYQPNGKHFTTAKDLAVVSYRHRIAEGSAQTELQLRGQPAAYHDRWFEDLIAHTGSGLVADQGGPDTPTLSVDPAPSGAVNIRVPWSRFHDYGHTEIHVGATSGFTPGPTTLIARGRQRQWWIGGPPGETQYYKAVHVDLSGNRSSASSAVAAAPGRAGPQLLHGDAQWFGRFPGQGFGVQTRGSNYPPDCWGMLSGTWGTNADLSASVRKTGDQSLRLINPSGELVSDYIPVTGSDPYRFEIEWQADSNALGNNLWARVEWHSAKGTVVQTDDIVRTNAQTANTWQVNTSRRTAPATARWMRLRIRTEEASAFNAFVDRIEGIKILPMFAAYLGGDSAALTNDAWTAVKPDTEIYDLGNVYDATSQQRFNAPTDGIYSFSCGALFNSCNEYAQVALYLNGGLRWASGADSVQMQETGDVRTSVAVEAVQLSRGDFVEMYARGRTSSGTLTIAGGSQNETWFSGRRIA